MKKLVFLVGIFAVMLLMAIPAAAATQNINQVQTRNIVGTAQTPTAIHSNKWFNSNPTIKRGQAETTWGWTLVNAKTGMAILPLPAHSTFIVLIDGRTQIGTVKQIQYGTQSISWTLTAKQTTQIGLGRHNLGVFFWNSPQYGPDHSVFAPSNWQGSFTVVK